MKIFSTIILIATMSIYTQASSNNVVVTENASTQQAKDKDNALKKKHDIRKETKERAAYPGVEWKPKEGDPKPNENGNAYPGVEWTPKQ